MTNSSPWYRWAIEIDGLPNLNMVIFHGYVKSPDGNWFKKTCQKKHMSKHAKSLWGDTKLFGTKINSLKPSEPGPHFSAVQSSLETTPLSLRQRWIPPRARGRDLQRPVPRIGEAGFGPLFHRVALSGPLVVTCDRMDFMGISVEHGDIIGI